MGLTREQLHRMGWKPDGRGSAIPVQPRECPPRRATLVEDRWLTILRDRHATAVIERQFRVRVSAWDAPVLVHYTADFACFFPYGSALGDFFKVVLWEVKDTRRRPHSDELTRPKMARAHNPWISAVMLAQWHGREWRERQLA
jgi:hypothetical protein